MRQRAKTFCAFVLVCLMVLSMLMNAAMAVTTGTTEDGFIYAIGGYAVTIIGYTGTAADIIIPHEVEGLPVVSIGERAFSNCVAFSSATIPSSVSSIGEDAFMNSYQLVIRGCTDYVQRYALARGIEFELIDDDKPGPDFDLKDLDCVISLDKSTLTVGESITASWVITGGTPPYKTVGLWFVKQATVDEEYQRTAKIVDNTCTVAPTIGESGYLLLIVSDAVNSVGFQSDAFSISGAPIMEPLNVDISFDRSAVPIGQPITASWTITGGEAPYKISPNWFTYEDGFEDEVHIPGEAAGNQCTLVPSDGIQGFFMLFITNANKWAREYDSEFFSITSANQTPGDATNDGTVDILDLVSIIDYIVSNNDPTSLTNADANGDGVVDILDLVWIIDQIVGG